MGGQLFTPNSRPGDSTASLVFLEHALLVYGRKPLARAYFQLSLRDSFATTSSSKSNPRPGRLGNTI